MGDYGRMIQLVDLMKLNNACEILFLNYFLLYFPQHTFFFPTVKHGDPVTHTCTHNFFSHCHAALWVSDMVLSATLQDLIVSPFQKQ